MKVTSYNVFFSIFYLLNMTAVHCICNQKLKKKYVINIKGKKKLEKEGRWRQEKKV